MSKAKTDDATSPKGPEGEGGSEQREVPLNATATVSFFSNRAAAKDFDIAFTRKLSSALREMVNTILPAEKSLSDFLCEAGS